MKTKTTLAIIVLVVFALIGVAFAEKAPQKAFELASGELKAYGGDPIIVNAVKQKNAKGETLAEIKKLDAEWKKTAGIDDYMKALMDSECGQYLQKLLDDKKYLSEAFVMDKLGANVAMADKTSDYWQGDEAKFIECNKGEAGTVHVSDVEFDESAQVYSVEVSVPVLDGGEMIGAICFEIDVDQID